MSTLAILILIIALVAVGLVVSVAGILVTRRRKPEPLPNT